MDSTMQFMMMYFLSFFISQYGNYKIDLKLNDDLASHGFKLKNTSKEKTYEYYITYIPIVNVFYMLLSMLDFVNNEGEIIDRLFLLREVTKLSKWEQEEYSKKGRHKNILKILDEYDRRMSNALKITVSEPLGLSVIYYNLSHDDVIVLDVSGPISAKSLIEQKQFVLDFYASLNDNSLVDNNHVLQNKESGDFRKEDKKDNILEFKSMMRDEKEMRNNNKLVRRKKK